MLFSMSDIICIQETKANDVDAKKALEIELV
jgi:exonuclease III